MVDAQEWSGRVENDRLLLVEGKDEVNLFSAIVSQMQIANLQVIDAGGKDQFWKRLLALLADARTRDIDLQSIGIVRDADTDGRAALQSVQGTLRRLNLPEPAAPRQLAFGSPGVPSIAILIIPNDSGPGDVEVLCWNSIQDRAAAECVRDYVACLKERGELESHSESKTLVHAFLASRYDPTASVGLGAQQGYWPLENPAFDPVREFIRLILSTPPV